MGKIAGNSWFTAVKRAFLSPTKENEKTGSRRREGNEPEEEEKKRGKRRWIFKKSSNQETTIQHREAKAITTTANITVATSKPASATMATTNYTVSEADDAEQQRHAIAVAMATTAAAQAAVATAQAAVEAVRLSRPSIYVKQYLAAIIIQTAFRGYLARRALRALKGLVKLQALVRGRNVRKRANMTLRCMQALVRVQARVYDQRKRLSSERADFSMSSDTNSLWESHLTDNKFTSIDESSGGENWVHWDHANPQILEDIQAMSQKAEEIGMKRENSLAYAFSEQIWRTERDRPVESEGELDDRKQRRLNRLTTREQWEDTDRVSCDHQREYIKTIEIDTSQPYSEPKFHKSQQHYQPQRPSSFSVPSPLHRAQNNLPLHSNITPSPSKTRPFQVYSASPCCSREEKNHQTPSSVPNYMAATASARARFRSQSAQRLRPSTPEREQTGSVKKRLSFPVPELRVDDDNIIHGMNKRSNMLSCCADSLEDEIYPASATDFRRRLR